MNHQPMQNPIVQPDFLLDTPVAVELYHDYAADLPIIDYHCHLSPQQIATDHQFTNLTDVWLRGDHYKWRAMRANGVAEQFITGQADDRAKHRHWAATVPYTLRNPLYHWSHLELDRYFGVRNLLSAENADRVYDQCTEQLGQPEFRVQGLLRRMDVRVVCTTDDPTDDLDAHRRHQQSSPNLLLVPGFRPDRALKLGDPDYPAYLERLGRAAAMEIVSYDDLLTALEKRIDYFHVLGGRVADHGLTQLYAVAYTEGELRRSFAQRRGGQHVSDHEAQQLQTALLVELGRMYHARGWVQQFHLGAIRNNNHRVTSLVGADAGVDSIGDYPQIAGLGHHLDALDRTDQLARTIVYNLNPADNEAIATMVGNFNDGSIAGKMQYGSAWWFLDQLDGMEKQLNVLSNLGLLSRFIGMLTDSRSFLSFPRHEYFRRLLCQLLGQDVRRGLLPDDRKLLGQLVQDISYHNARRYFNFPE